MFEVQTYQVILNRILKRFPESEDIRPSSPLYIATGPAAKEFEVVYGELDWTLDQVFPTTSSRKYLIQDAKTYNMEPYEATKAIVEGEFDTEIDIGTRFTSDGLGFVVTERIDRASIEYYYYKLECEEVGEVGNVLSGVIVPDMTIPDLKHAYITRILIPGEEEEDTESFRERYLASFNSKAYGGNLADYLEKVTAISGVGRAKILRCRDFEGNVKPEWVGVVIMDSQNKKPSDELVESVQEIIQPLGVDSYPDLETSGLGIAPIGHLVYVKGVEETTIDLGLKLTFDDNYSWDKLEKTIIQTMEKYIESEAAKWGDVVADNQAKAPLDTHVSIVRARIESLLIDIEGIIDANDTMINGSFKNYDLAWNCIPVLGEVAQHDETDIGGGEESCPYNCPDCAYNRNPSLCERVLEA